jgi:serine/threonine protein kinase
MEKVGRAYAEQAGFEFRDKVGAGAFKETFLVAKETELLALKVLGDNCSTIRTEREIDALQRCAHPNIATLQGVSEFIFEGKSYTCLIEDYLAGGTLADRLQKSLLDRDTILELGSDLLLALAHLHGLGLVHRDIKPENIMFREAGSTAPVIVDFGLVRNLAASSVTQSWFAQGPGTPLFAAPEQLNNRKEMIDWRTDQFAAGVTLGFCLLGFHSHSLPTDVNYECVDRVANWQRPSGRFVKAVDQETLSLLARMVQPYPVQRVRTPDRLLEMWVAQ